MPEKYGSVKASIGVGLSDETLRKLLGADYIQGKETVRIDRDLPTVKRPIVFRPDPQILSSDRDLIRAVQETLKLAPQLRGKVNKVYLGPSEGVINELIDSGFSPYDYENTNLRGLFDYLKKEISINPRETSYEMLESVPHEFSHSSGFGEGVSRLAGLEFQRRAENAKIRRRN